MNNFRKRLLIATALASWAAPALALDVHLVARPFVMAMPDGVAVPMWGFALDPDGAGPQPAGAPQVPGPLLDVPPGDGTLRVTLTNELAVPVSLMIPGQPAPTDPTWIGPDGAVTATGARPAGDVTSRVRSMMPETAPGATRVYEWTNLRPGTFLYHSSTHPQVQVQMGLYGGMRRPSAAGQAYPGIAVDNEAFLLFSEIDPALHEAVADGTYGGDDYPSTINYVPKYFLVNGAPAPDAAPLLDHPIQLGETVLLRLVNAGLQTHVPLASGLSLSLVAEDGHPYPFARPGYSALLPAGKTTDAVFTADKAGVYAVWDRMLGLVNDREPGGMLVHLRIPGGGAPIAAADVYTGQAGAMIEVSAQSGTLANDSDAEGDPLTAHLVGGPANGTLSLAADGGFTYAPASGFAGVDTFTYRAHDGTAYSADATVTLAVGVANRAPVAVADSYAATEDQPLAVAAPGVLGNDSDPDGDMLMAGLARQPTRGKVVLAADGSFVYTPAPNYNGADSFVYVAMDGMGNSTTATVALSIANVNDAPDGEADSFSVQSGSPRTIAAPGVLANDTDLDGDGLTAVAQTAPSNGTLALNADGSFTYTPTGTFTGDSFTYAPHDGTAAGAPVTVTLKVNAAPIANADEASTGRNKAVVIAVTANDWDTDGTVDAATVVIADAPNRGGTAVVGAGGAITYTPPKNFTGREDFTYRVRDDLGAWSNRGAVTVRVGK